MNKLTINTIKALTLLTLSVSLFSCRKDDNEKREFIPTEAGLYLLNEGNWGSNKASLDYLNLETGVYEKDVFSAANPSATLGLGDVGNDIRQYGSKIYVVINASNKVEVLDAKTAKRISVINIENCRYITFYKNKAYISSYDGNVHMVDTANASEVLKKIRVGNEPEEMAVVGDKLYVANSGGYMLPPANDYERTVSIINLTTNEEIKRIDVGINLNRLKKDAYGDIYVTSRGDWNSIEQSLYVIDTKTDEVKKHFEIPASNFTIYGDYAYILSYSYLSNEKTFVKINVKDESVVSDKFIKDGSESNIIMPYGIAIDPKNEDIYVTDAKGHTTSGQLNIYNKDGIFKKSYTTGDIPAHMLFIAK